MAGQIINRLLCCCRQLRSIRYRCSSIGSGICKSGARFRSWYQSTVCASRLSKSSGNPPTRTLLARADTPWLARKTQVSSSSVSMGGQPASARRSIANADDSGGMMRIATMLRCLIPTSLPLRSRTRKIPVFRSPVQRKSTPTTSASGRNPDRWRIETRRPTSAGQTSSRERPMGNIGILVSLGRGCCCGLQADDTRLTRAFPGR